MTRPGRCVERPAGRPLPVGLGPALFALFFGASVGAASPQVPEAGSDAGERLRRAAQDGDRRAVWFDIPDGTHSSTAVRVQLRVANNLGSLGGRPDYGVGVRADFAPRGANRR